MIDLSAAKSTEDTRNDHNAECEIIGLRYGERCDCKDKTCCLCKEYHIKRIERRRFCVH